MTISVAAKRFAKLLLPPIIIKPITWLTSSRQAPVLEYLPNGERDLISADEIGGWNVESVIEAEAAKWHAFTRHLVGTGPLGFSHESTEVDVVRDIRFHNIHVSFAYVLALAAWNRNSIGILDWGGGLGHYGLVAKAVLPEVSVDYSCRELPLMCDKGRELCPSVTFYEDDSCLAKRFDLVVLSGTLGYMEDWRDSLPRIAASSSYYLYLTRVTVLENSPSVLLLHRTDEYDYNSTMLVRVFNRAELLEVVGKAGFEVAREFVFADPYQIPGVPEQCQEIGWLFKRVGDHEEYREIQST